ncbi:unnamed protein product [Porites lobata]|uniref:Uncharacterized protein n=1 Tax=Porites lobata TaxID=104759 RepID=A0ABN8QVT5_9CNID|nr:unnamed protein product [Porites lobata]
MEMCCSCFMDTKYKCLRCKIPISNQCSVFEENEDVEGWRAGRSVAYCEACDRELKRATQGLTLSEEQSIGSFRSSETERDCKNNDEMEPLEEEEEGEEEENVDEEEEPPKKKKNKRAKRGPRGLWKQDLVDDLVDIIITNDYYQRKLIFVNTKNQQNGKVYEKVLKELKSRAGGKGNSVPFTVAQVRTKFKKCISECKKAALTIKTATGVKRFQDDKNYGVWFDRLFELVKTRDSCRPDLATEPLMNVPVTDCNDNVDNEDQDLAKDHTSTQLFVPVKTAPKKRKRKGDNTEILTEAVNLLKTAVESDASKEMLAFLKEDIEKSREHELKLFKLLCTQDGLQQPSFYPSYNPYMPPVAPPFRTGVMPGYARMYGGEPTGRPLPATSTATVTSDLLHNIMSENASSSDERPINRDL